VRLHANAKTTPRSRLDMVRCVLERGWTQERTADSFHVSVATVRKWARRYRAQGEAGLADRRSDPRRMPRRTPVELREEIERLRRRRFTAHRIARRLGLPLSTVSRILKQRGLGRLRLLEPPERVVRYQREHAGSLVHLDTKKLGKIGRIGHRITGDRRSRVRGIGWEYAHVAVDDATRTSFTQMHRDERQETAVRCLRRMVRWYAAHGVRVAQVMTDNGSAYRSKAFQKACAELGIRHLFTKPYRPQTNGKAERFIQTLLREWAYAKPYKTSRQRTAALDGWLRYYNRRRPHTALGYRTPWVALRRSSA
jgi:transposase InsO family protein